MMSSFFMDVPYSNCRVLKPNLIGSCYATDRGLSRTAPRAEGGYAAAPGSANRRRPPRLTHAGAEGGKVSKGKKDQGNGLVGRKPRPRKRYDDMKPPRKAERAPSA